MYWRAKESAAWYEFDVRFRAVALLRAGRKVNAGPFVAKGGALALSVPEMLASTVKTKGLKRYDIVSGPSQ